MSLGTLVLLRHGESEWNAKNLFTGWVDVDLNDKGEAEARRGGELLREHDLLPDVVHTSVLRRAIRTAELALRRRRPALDPGAPVVAAQRASLRRPAGQEQEADARDVRRGAVHALAPLVRHAAPADRRRRRVLAGRRRRGTPTCRRSCCPAPSASRTCSPGCCRTGTTRSCPTCAPAATVLVAAHGNSLRALVKHLDGISDEAIAGLNIPTGIPLRYDLDPATLRPLTPGGVVPRPGGGGRGRCGGGQPGTVDLALDRVYGGNFRCYR